MIFLTIYYVCPCRIAFRNIIKASAGKSRLGVRVASRGFFRDGIKGALSRSRWVAVGAVV